MTKRTFVGFLAAAILAVFPAAGAQASPIDDQYGNPVQNETPPAVIQTETPPAVTPPAVTPPAVTPPAVIPTETPPAVTPPTVIQKETPPTLIEKRTPPTLIKAPAKSGSPGSELPFTGLELGLIVAGGAAAAGAGLVLRRATRGRRA